MGKRKSLSKKVRFEVFKRDSFTCQYCGNVPPSVVLEIDHIHPASKGGDNSEDNLITSCFDCNRGKSNGLLEQIPDTLSKKQAVLEEKESQIKEYNKLLSRIKARETRIINKIEEAFQWHYPARKFSDSFKQSVRSFAKKLPKDDLIDAITSACIRTDGYDSAAKYFCGICWRKIREQENG